MIDGTKTPRHHWIVCESGNRWRQCVLRLVPEWLGLDHSLAVKSLAVKNVLAGEVLAATLRLPHGVLLWELDAASTSTVTQAISSLSVDRDRWLQIVAVDQVSPRDRLSPRELCSLSEMGVAAVIEQPEELPRLGRMISGHFAGAQRLLH